MSVKESFDNIEKTFQIETKQLKELADHKFTEAEIAKVKSLTYEKAVIFMFTKFVKLDDFPIKYLDDLINYVFARIESFEFTMSMKSIEPESVTPDFIKTHQIYMVTLYDTVKNLINKIGKIKKFSAKKIKAFALKYRMN